MTGTRNALERLAATIEARRGADPETGWTAKLLARGPEKCAEKFGEEAIETVIAALSQDRQALISESADLVYHWLVLLASRGIALEEVMAELDRRTAQSGLEEKASRADAAD